MTTGGRREMRTERLRLRPPTARDLEPFALMCADAEVMRYIGLGRPLDRGSAELAFAVLLERWNRDGTGLFTVEDGATAEYLGFAGLAPVPEGSVEGGSTEIGWRLRRAVWGRGLATEGARAVGAYAADVLGLDRVVALVAPENAPSRRVAVKLGLDEIGRGKGPRGETAVVYAGAPPRPAAAS